MGERLRPVKEGDTREATGKITPSTLGEVAPLRQSLFPAEAKAERLPKSKRGPR
jgi:hypothetical protein